jgi:hypothetical protein
MKDMLSKGRGHKSSQVGENNSNSKLTFHDVVEIRLSSEWAKKLAIRFGVTRTQIYNIKRGSSWKGHNLECI